MTTKTTTKATTTKPKRVSPTKGTKKEIKILPAGAYWYMKYEGGGQLPGSLVGIFTSYGEAEARLDVFKGSKK
jgi:hypothetical protein